MLQPFITDCLFFHQYDISPHHIIDVESPQLTNQQ
jgi:hypothetical protein